MAKITEKMREVAGNATTWVLATVSSDGMPNAVPVNAVKIISDDEILVMNQFLNKSDANLKANPDKVAVSVWDPKSLKGYQFKGEARIETSGDIFDDGVRMVKSMMAELESKSAVVIKVKSIYITTPGPNAGKEAS